MDPPKVTKFEDAPIPAMNQEPLQNSMRDPPKILKFEDGPIPAIN
jgi:hypothetical protein